MLAVNRPPGGRADDSGVVSNQAKEILERGTKVMGSSENVLVAEAEALLF